MLTLRRLFTGSVVTGPLCLLLSSQLAQAQDRSIFQEGAAEDEAARSLTKKPLLNVAGSWSGTIDDSLGGTGTFTAEFSQTKNKVGGTWSAVFKDLTNNGSISGTVTTDSATIDLDHPLTGFPHCHSVLRAKPASDTSISGPYTVSSCGKLFKGEHGTISITPDSPD
jgi:hypothetical protein